MTWFEGDRVGCWVGCGWSSLQSKGLHAGPHWSSGNSCPIFVQDSYSDIDPPSIDCRNTARWPHVNVPAPSVTGVFHTASVQAEQPQYDIPSEGGGFAVGDLEGTGVGEANSCEGSAEIPLLKHVPRWQAPKGIELQGVASGKTFGGGQLPSGLQDTVNSQSFPLPHKQTCSCSSLYVQKPSNGYSSSALR